MRLSIYAFIITLVLGLVSMGALGALLYYAVTPIMVMVLKYPPLDTWHGDWVWPSMIGVGMLWSLGFLLAGWAYLMLETWVLPVLLYKLAYVAILWVWALVVWLVVLKLGMP